MTHENGVPQQERPPSSKPAIREGVIVGHTRSYYFGLMFVSHMIFLLEYMYSTFVRSHKCT